MLGADVSLLVTIDAECDKGIGWRPHFPLKYRSITEGVGQKLKAVFQRHGIKPTYFLSPEVMRDAASREVLLSIDHQVENATHLHPEHAAAPQNGVETPPADNGPGLFQCRLSAQEEFQQLENLTSLFHETFGRAPVSFRAGRFGAGKNTLRSLQKLGYRNDSSVTPHVRWGDSPSEMNFTSSPEQPYFPDADDLARKPSNAGTPVSQVLEFPVSITGSFIGDALRSHFLLEHGQNLIKRAVRRTVQPRWLRPSTDDVIRMFGVCKALIERHAPNGPVMLVMFFHAGEVVGGATPYSMAPGNAEKILRRIDELLALLRKQGVRSLTMAEAGDYLRDQAAH